LKDGTLRYAHISLVTASPLLFSVGAAEMASTPEKNNFPLVVQFHTTLIS
jgi:hypothetical protein